MSQWGQVKYRLGAVWRCERNKNLDHLSPEMRAKEMTRDKFNFVVIGPGTREGYKLCQLEIDDRTSHLNGLRQEYSHRHLNKCADYKSEKPSERADRLARMEIEHKAFLERNKR